jgi:hypothetical protein
VHDRQDRLNADHDCDAGDVPAEHVCLEGHRLLAARRGAARRGGSWSRCLGDHLGVPWKVVDDAGAVVWDGIWEPFGVVDEVVPSVLQPFRLPGQYETRHPFFGPDQHLCHGKGSRPGRIADSLTP